MNSNQNRKISTINLSYQPGMAISYFDAIASQPWAMLLHSASASHPDSRFDIIVAEPIATIQTHGTTSVITHSNETVRSEEDPFLLVERYLDRLLPKLKPVDGLPFIGGALGYFSYDLGRRVERIPNQAIQDIDAPDMAIGLYDWALIVDNQMKSATLVGEAPEERLAWLTDQAAPSSPPFSLTSEWQSNLSKLAYAKRFDAVQDFLLAGDCYQINLAQRLQADYVGSEWSAYLRLAQENGGPFSAYISIPESTILSVSPERFLRLEQGEIQTKPIKGTRPRSGDPAVDQENIADLLIAEKDQAENLMIVDLLRNDIGRVATPGSVQVPHLFEVESFPAVHHLVSTITARLDKSYSATNLLRACFPGGSITGAPKVRAMQIIESLEPHRRSAYCGSIGYISRCGDMDTSITIRTLVTNNQAIYAWAGGGIVADSECDAEYQETLDKLSRIVPLLTRYFGHES